jgi:hypothetical protein
MIKLAFFIQSVQDNQDPASMLVSISMFFCIPRRTLTKWAIVLMVDDHQRFFTVKQNHRLSQLNTFNVTMGARLCGKLA